MYGRALWCLLERLVYELVYVLLSVSEKRFLHLTFGSAELVTPKPPLLHNALFAVVRNG